MLKSKSIMFIIFLFICMSGFMTAYNFYVVYPSYTHLLIQDTEDEAIRTGSYIGRKVADKLHSLERGADSREFAHLVHELRQDLKFTKLKIFSKEGATIYSTDSKDVGVLNKYDYFHNIVAKGKPYTKVVAKDAVSLEGERVTKDVVETYVPLMDDGGFIGAFEIYYDITKRKAALDQVVSKSSRFPLLAPFGGLAIIILLMFKLDRSIAKQKETKAALISYSEKLQASNRELESFAHIASHDLQEPLRKVMAFGDRLTAKYSDVLDERGLDYLNRMQSATSRMQKLIESLLTFSRITTKAKPFVHVDLNQIAKEVLTDLDVRIEETGAKVEAEGLIALNADPLQMRQLLQNLIGNALKFSKEDEPPHVKISGRLVSDKESNGPKGHGGKKYYELTISDNGIGFQQEYSERIFGVFQRLHGRKEYEGTGIGLSICRRIVERHNGRIEAKSAEGQGASFIVALPLEQEKGAV